MPVKTVIMDASSAIILCKADLHKLLVDIYDIVLPATVFREITAQPYPGAAEYQQLASEGKIRIREKPARQVRLHKGRMAAGEYDMLQLFSGGLGDFLVTDDGPAARFCKKAGIPFINALLFPAVLRFAQLKSDDFCLRATARVIGAGRYSPEVIAFAEQCQREDIAFALP